MSQKVSLWLEDLGLGKYSEVFEENEIGWDLLPELDQTTLKDIGVEIAGHRLRILKAVSTIDSNPQTEIVKAKPAIKVPDDATAWSRTPGERKPVTMLFADIVSSTHLTEQLDAEDAHSLLYRATQLMCESVENNRGTVCRFMGDGIMAMFGAPIASERHALEACQAALDMQTAISRYDKSLEAGAQTTLQIRVGLNSGEVVVLEVGDDPEKPEYDASGPTVPVAARMEQSAQPGSILITGDTYALAGHRIDAEALPAIAVKGISEPLKVYQLNGVTSIDNPDITRDNNPLIGRKSELAQFRGLVESCLESGHGQTIYIRGEAGIGKTRLVEEMISIAVERGFASYKALVLDFGAGKGQKAIPSLVRSLLNVHLSWGKREREAALDNASNAGIVSSDHRVFLNDLLDLRQPLKLRTLYDAMGPQVRKDGKRNAVVQILKNLAEIRPVLVFIEDLHWADAVTLDYLAQIAAQAGECPSLLVLTSRVEGDQLNSDWRASTGDAPVVTWDLSPLRTDEAMTLVSTYIDSTDNLAKRCIERAAGNPLFLKQLLLSVEKGVGENVPDSIKSLVLARMDQLDREDKLALQACSALGQRFELEALRFLIDSPDYECSELAKRHLLRADGTLYQFTHALIQEGAYSSLLKQHRNEWHLRAASWYDGKDLILHAEHLGYAGDPQAATAYCKAARQQYHYFRPEQALNLVRSGLGVTDEAGEFELKCLEGELSLVLGMTRESTEAFRYASKHANNEIERCRALIGLAEGLGTSAEHELLVETLGEAEALAKNNNLDLELSKVLRARAGVLFFRGDNDACLKTSSAALDYAHKSGSTEMVAKALSTMGDAEYNRGSFSLAFEYFDQCLELARKHGLGQVIAANLSMRGYISHFRNDHKSFIEDYAEAIELAQKTRDLRSEFMALTGGFMLVEKGEFEEGMEWLSRGYAIVLKLGSKLFEAEYLYLMAKAEHLLGRPDDALKHANEAVAILQKTESGMNFRGPTALGISALTSNDANTSRALLMEAEKWLAGDCLDHNYIDFYEDAMQACLDLNEWDDALRYAQALEDFTAADPIPRCTLFATRGRALAKFGRGDRGPEIFEVLEKLYKDISQLGFIFALPEIETALQSK